MSMNRRVWQTLSLSVWLAAFGGASLASDHRASDRMVGSWQLAGSRHPLTVTLDLSPSEMELRGSCESLGGKYVLSRDILKMVDPVVVDGPCFNQIDAAANAAFKIFVAESNSPFRVNVEAKQLTLTSSSGARLTFDRVQGQPP